MSKILAEKEATIIKLGTNGASTGILIPATWTEITKLREEPTPIINLRETKYGFAIHIYKPKNTQEEKQWVCTI